MPFESEKQRRYLWANEPEVAREFASKEKTGNPRPAKLSEAERLAERKRVNAFMEQKQLERSAYRKAAAAKAAKAKAAASKTPAGKAATRSKKAAELRAKYEPSAIQRLINVLTGKGW